MLRVQESNLLFPLCGEMTDSLTRIPCDSGGYLPPPQCIFQPHINRASILPISHSAYVRVTCICSTVTRILSSSLNVAYVPVASTDCTLSSCLGDIPVGIDAEHLIADFRC